MSGNQPKLGKNDRVTDKDLKELSGLLTDEWRNVGRALGVDEATIQRLLAQNVMNHREAIHQVLLKWKKDKGGDATYGVLAQVLREEGRTDLAEQMPSA